jgi:hypothetical protein
MENPAEQPTLEDQRRRETPTGPAERHRESSVLTQVYDRCREAFMMAEVAFGQFQQAVSRGRFDGPERDEFMTRIGTHHQWAHLALWMADAEVERFAEDLQR